MKVRCLEGGLKQGAGNECGFSTRKFSPELLVRASYPGDPEHTDALLTLPSRLTGSSATMTPTLPGR